MSRPPSGHGVVAPDLRLVTSPGVTAGEASHFGDLRVWRERLRFGCRYAFPSCLTLALQHSQMVLPQLTPGHSAPCVLSTGAPQRAEIFSPDWNASKRSVVMACMGPPGVSGLGGLVRPDGETPGRPAWDHAR